MNDMTKWGKPTRKKRVKIPSIRRGQAIVPFGIGSIVDFPDQSLMPCGIDLWDKNAGERIFDERLQSVLGVSHFRMPPTKESYPRGIPFVRFPRWLFCPKCRSLKSLDEWSALYQSIKHEKFHTPRCHVCFKKLVPSRFVVACSKGHIDDFPYIAWVHGNQTCDKPDMEIRNVGGGSGLEGINIRCKSCKKSRTMKGAFAPEALSKVMHCSGNMPWQRKREGCGEALQTIQRGGSNAYFPKIMTSIVIPPGSDDLSSEIEMTPQWHVLSSMSMNPEQLNSVKDILIRQIADHLDQELEKVKRIIDRKLDNVPFDQNVEPEEAYIAYLHQEYQAFLGNIDEGQLNSKDFNIEMIEGDKYQIEGLDTVVLVHRLREVRALVGFSRITPSDKYELYDDSESKSNDQNSSSEIVPVKLDKKIDWYPAMEVRGEGIFLKFDSEALQEWSERSIIKSRTQILNERLNWLLQERGLKRRSIQAKFIFLHTFAHLLIRQLAFECGYASASLKERIYCNGTLEQPQMEGILIYTASGDSEGTLGGLVRQGRPDLLPNIILKALENSKWCSNDPICMESTGQGVDSLNLAACHACGLLPETSCEEGNKLLDRLFVVGTDGFLDHLI